ncbi:MAG: PmoA family protein [Ignavibacteriales bacterium]|nr:PmoA family protein [Ignavibacteriales bacterium]MCB9259944.1 PmoA family protein [Ignavibacteriales bacterium]
MKIISKNLIASIFILATSLTAQTNNLSAELQDDMIIVRIDNVTFTSYRFGDGQKYPYFYPVNGPETGLSVTTESSLPYPHHRSLWFGCDRVNGGNYWQEGNERGQIISKGAQIVENDSTKILIKDECVWKQPDQDPIISDERNIIITAPSDSIRIIDFKISLLALTDLTILKTNHSLFSARMEENLSVKKGGTLVNAEGKIGEKNTAEIQSAWCDYYGERFGIVEGLSIFDSPKNVWFPSKWFTRDYGFFSPTNLNWINEDIQIDKGANIEFQYRVIVHSGDTETAKIKEHFTEWTSKIK